MEIAQEKLQELKAWLQRMYDLHEMAQLEGARQALMILLPEDIFDTIDPLP